jgi:peptide/nickel transport system ATP-binding protein
MYAGRIVEYGPTQALTSAPAHPYTMGLMNASPDLYRVGEPLVPIEGAPPDLAHPPPGCRFAPRCPFALPACRETDPGAVAVGEGHRAACLRAGEAGALRELARKAATWSR